MQTHTNQSRGWRLLRPFLYLLTAKALLLAAPDSSATPLVAIVEPPVNQTYSETVNSVVQLSDAADPATFTAHLNGSDVTRFFSLACTGPAGCQEKAALPAAFLLAGTNVLVIDVGGPNNSIGTGRTKFEFNSASINNEPLERMISSVAINAMNLPAKADGNQINNYQIVVGPGPGFSQTIYTAAKLGCTAGPDSIQVLVLGRKTLTPETRVGQSGSPGQSCFADAASLAAFFKTVPAGDLVIVSSFAGASVPGLNTTAIGGTDYNSGQVVPYYYNAIGVAGATPGVAYEGYQTFQRVAINPFSPLTGSLMLDVNQNYFFVPSQYREFRVTPNDPAINSPLTTTICCFRNGAAESNSLLPGINGAFLLRKVDRYLPGYDPTVGLLTYYTNQTDPARSTAAIAALAHALRIASPDNLIILTTVGVPFSSQSQITSEIASAISKLHGNPYMLARLTPPADGVPVSYTLISSSDPEYLRSGNVVENSSVWSDQKETGQVHGILAHDRKNRWFVKAALSDPPADGSGSLITWAWEQVGFQQPQDWPIWTSGQQNAYVDLTVSYNSVRRALGCSSLPCQPIRSYYDGAISGTGAPPPVASLDYGQVNYADNPAYTREDLSAVVTQLEIEQGYLKNIYALYSLFKAVTYASDDNISTQLSKVAKNIDSSVKTTNPNISAEDLSKAAAISSILGAIPVVGPAFSGLSSILRGASSFVTSPDGVPDGSYGTTLDDLINETRSFGTNLANSNDVMFTAIVNDWGKMRIIGEGYGTQTSPWYMCPTCTNGRGPSVAIPTIALGAKQQFYLRLLPTVYSLDRFLNVSQTDPTKTGGMVRISSRPDVYQCVRSYVSATSASWLVYSHVGGNGTRDMFIITRTVKEPNNFPVPGYPATLFFPFPSLSDDLFGLPLIANGTLSGGAGLIKDQLLPSDWAEGSPHSGTLPLREGQTGGVSVCTVN